MTKRTVLAPVEISSHNKYCTRTGATESCEQIDLGPQCRLFGESLSTEPWRAANRCDDCISGEKLAKLGVRQISNKLKELESLERIIVDAHEQLFEPREGKTMSVRGMLVDLLDMIGD